jgi:zinc protease
VIRTGAAFLAALALLGASATARQSGSGPQASGPVAPAASPVATIQAAPGAPAATSWQHAGSDIPADPAWRTGTLPNGLRYAVRRNARPPGSISVRIRIDAGGLMEEEAEQGWAHLLEHMTFRGTATVPDGEGIRIWQRLGARFGADTNAFTSLRSTSYVLDLPRADAESYAQALRVMAEMMQSARIDAKLLATERQVVAAEGAQRRSPLARELQDASRALFLAGTRAGKRDIIGSPETLANATADRLRAFYKRWYRPERAVVVVVGDADPALLETEVQRAFSGWTADGKPPVEPDYGSPTTPAKPVLAVTDPQAANTDSLGWVARHDDAPVTIAEVQRQLVESVALGIVNRRFAAAEESGGALVDASAGLSRGRHVGDQLTVSLLPRPGQNRAALDQVFAILNALRATPPTEAEVEQGRAGLRRSAVDRVTLRTSVTSGGLANQFVADVDRGDVTADPRFYLETLKAFERAITPDAVNKVLVELLAPPPRLLRATTDPALAASAAADLAAARQAAAAKDVAVRAVSLSELPSPGVPGTVISRSRIDDLDIDRVRFANGVTLDFKKTGFERNTVRVSVRVGRGLLAQAPNDPGLFWTSGALGAAGFGPFTREELARLAAGRRVSFSIGSGLDGIGLATATSRGDLADTLRLMTGALTQMRYAEGPVARIRDGNAATYASLYSQPGSVLSAFGAPYLYGGDTRFRGVPPLAEIERLKLADVTRFWTGQLAQGPIRVSAVGDLDADALIAAVARTFGALPPRPDQPVDPAYTAVRPTPPPGGAAILHHRGAPDQASVARVFPVLGYRQEVQVGRALGLAAAIVQDRLTSEFRETEAGTYAPSASVSQIRDLPAYGTFVAGAQLKVDRIADFDRALARILADLAANGPDADALERARTTAIATIERARASDNGYWLGLVANSIDDPRDLEAVRTAIPGRKALTVADIRAAVTRYLTPGKSFAINVLPAAAQIAPARP